MKERSKNVSIISANLVNEVAFVTSGAINQIFLSTHIQLSKSVLRIIDVFNMYVFVYNAKYYL